MAERKIVVQRRIVKAKQVPNIWEALEIQDKLLQEQPGAPVVIERTEGGGLHSYRVVVVEPVKLKVPAKPALKPLPYPKHKSRVSYGGSRARPSFGSILEFDGDYEFQREVTQENGKVFHENRAKLGSLDEKMIAPQFRR